MSEKKSQIAQIEKEIKDLMEQKQNDKAAELMTTLAELYKQGGDPKKAQQIYDEQNKLVIDTLKALQNDLKKKHNNYDEKIEIINQIREIIQFITFKKFSNLIPEVRMNIAGALPNAKDREEVAGVDGRITTVNNMPKAAGDIKFGVAEHTARLVLTAKKYDNSINFAMNIKYSPELIRLIQENTEFELKEILREKQPEQIKSKEFSTMQWLIKECVDMTGHVPDIIWDKGAMGKEPMIRLFAKTSTEMIEKLREITKLI
jgi:hydroxymethylpyrimidine/phosphomethylpyrimidine kinase